MILLTYFVLLRTDCCPTTARSVVLVWIIDKKEMGNQLYFEGMKGGSFNVDALCSLCCCASNVVALWLVRSGVNITPPYISMELLPGRRLLRAA